MIESDTAEGSGSVDVAILDLTTTSIMSLHIVDDSSRQRGNK